MRCKSRTSGFPTVSEENGTRSAQVSRKTNETTIEVGLDLDGSEVSVETGIAFFDHMLDQVGRHGRLGLLVKATGDLEVDPHHTVEDTGIAIGEAVRKALGDKAGVKRFAAGYTPLDESLARVVLDLSGRAGLFYRASFSRQKVGELDVQLVREFFKGFVNSSAATLHVDLLEGSNAHHQVESIFKAFALALGEATSLRGDSSIPSTKGVL